MTRQQKTFNLERSHVSQKGELTTTRPSPQNENTLETPTHCAHYPKGANTLARIDAHDTTTIGNTTSLKLTSRITICNTMRGAPTHPHTAHMHCLVAPYAAGGAPENGADPQTHGSPRGTAIHDDQR